MIFLLIVDTLQTLDMLSHEINDFSTHRGHITDFECVALRDQLCFYSSWTNYRLWMCCPTGPPIFFSSWINYRFGCVAPRDQ
ncbi:hypothetical protein TNCV_2743721 [Trichonephila clavipes]|nr:hypothetical protein TNCV_2743721 [Trichonephila clavipes]